MFPLPGHRTPGHEPYRGNITDSSLEGGDGKATRDIVGRMMVVIEAMSKEGIGSCNANKSEARLKQGNSVPLGIC